MDSSVCIIQKTPINFFYRVDVPLFLRNWMMCIMKIEISEVFVKFIIFFVQSFEVMLHLFVLYSVLQNGAHDKKSLTISRHH